MTCRLASCESNDDRGLVTTGRARHARQWNIEMWLSLVERYVRDVEVASSNLVISTNKKSTLSGAFLVAPVGFFDLVVATQQPSSHSPLGGRQARLADEERGNHVAKRSYLVISKSTLSGAFLVAPVGFFDLVVVLPLFISSLD